MTQLFFGGGEIPNFREILSEFPGPEGNPAISLSYLNLMRNEKRIPEYHGPMFLDSGALSISKSDAEFDFVYDQASQYMQFAKDNIDKVNMVSEFDAQQLTLPVIKQLRAEFYNSLPELKFMPVWHPDYGNEELENLCASYPLVGVTQEDIHGDPVNVPLFNSMISRYGVYLHGVGITSKKILEAVKWSSVSSTAWLSTTRYGELFVWTGRELKRYPKAYKDRAAKTHRTLLIDNGFDYEKIDNNDTDELLRLSVWSWQSYVSSVSNGVTTLGANKSGKNSLQGSGRVDTQRIQAEQGSRSQNVVKPRETTALPVVSQVITAEENENGVYEARSHLNVRSESMRICDTCFLREKCPGFEPQSTCLYNIPIEVKTKQQLKNLQNALVEIQSQRVLFMKMAEDLSGGYADPNLSSEIDRLQRLIKVSSEADQDKFSMSVTMSQGSKGPSFVERMLGSSVSSKVQELESPVDADTFIMDTELGKLVDAEIVE